MDQKKKPPPGATLISRLREGRQRRDQALTERKEQASREALTRLDQKEPIETPSHIMSSPASRAKSKEAQTAAKEETQASKTTAISFKAQPCELIHRSISIDDLRPTNNDYVLLTEEIHLAGRFAAAGLIAQGLRLARIKDDYIYKNYYTTFEEYCRQEHSMNATYAYRLIRMSEMAERLTKDSPKTASVKLGESMPDPFEVMLGLGHRHLLALLPVTVDAAEELLIHGVPLTNDKGKLAQRIPITKATEQQIRQALRVISPPSEPTSKKLPKVPVPTSVRSLQDLVEVLQDWVDWLESVPEQQLLAAKIGQGRERKRLAQRARTLVDRMLELIE